MLSSATVVITVLQEELKSQDQLSINNYLSHTYWGFSYLLYKEDIISMKMSNYCQSILVFLFVLVVMPLSITKAVDNWGDFDPYADRVEPCPGDGNLI